MAAAGSSRLRGRAGHYLAITHLARPAPGPTQQTVLDSFVALGSCGPVCQSRVFHSSARLNRFRYGRKREGWYGLKNVNLVKLMVQDNAKSIFAKNKRIIEHVNAIIIQGAAT